MSEFMMSDHPAFFPQACIACTGTTGPVVDTHRELPDGQRVYLCEMCVSRSAHALGLLKGKQMNDLRAAARKTAQAEKDAAALLVKTNELEQAVAERDQRIDQLFADLESANGKLEGLKAHLAAEAERAMLAVSE